MLCKVNAKKEILTQNVRLTKLIVAIQTYCPAQDKTIVCNIKQKNNKIKFTFSTRKSVLGHPTARRRCDKHRVLELL